MESDSKDTAGQGALRRFGSTTIDLRGRDAGSKSMLVKKCGDVLKSLARQKEVGFVWVSEHMAIPVNERADQLARLWSGEPHLGFPRSQSLESQEEVSMGSSADGPIED
ncbi:hypothetical protein NQ315_000094 [Exocentrus adspersus]|uniref:RNase H type-1 domain-containing protein n=1 Tax=Exocentrus adspersus TaxID=1586481 RepID=A0AAV8VT85_9CUCU|nr:hypothetical protein NQ315_000094 [Exocentrus adspersus]